MTNNDIDDLLKDIAGAPLRHDLRTHCADLLIAAGRIDDAEGLLRTGLIHDPESIGLRRHLAILLGSTNRPKDALVMAREILYPLHQDIDFCLHYASWLMNDGQYPVAIAELQKILRLTPDYPPALHALAHIWRKLGEHDKAIPIEKKLGIAGTAHDAIEAPNEAYIRALFDTYAPSFDAGLEKLHYQAPKIIYEMVLPMLGARQDFHILDLGCGTGLAGVYFKDFAKSLIGIDLSDNMLMEARKRGIYDDLIQGEIIHTITQYQPRADMIIASDVLAYSGDLDSFFMSVAGALAMGGIFVATVEKIADTAGDFILQKTRRYAHSADYIQRVAKQAGLDIVVLETAPSLRREGNGDIEGIVFVLRKIMDTGTTKATQPC